MCEMLCTSRRVNDEKANGRKGECTSGARLPNGLTIEPEHLMISRPDDADTLKPVPEPWSSARPRLRLRHQMVGARLCSYEGYVGQVGAFLGVLTTFGKRPPGALAQ
jgi:hypothetical protein